MNYDRAWLLTWTTYGTWLPGDPRGFVGYTRDEHWEKIISNATGTECNQGNEPLRRYAQSIQKESTVLLKSEQASLMAEQFRETANYRHWQLPAFAIMANHVHLVVLVQEDPAPEIMLHSFKSYASRKLNVKFGKRSWWTSSGSTRKLPDDSAVKAATEYIRKQHRPLILEVSGEPPTGVPPTGEPCVSTHG